MRPLWLLHSRLKFKMAAAKQEVIYISGYRPLRNKYGYTRCQVPIHSIDPHTTPLCQKFKMAAAKPEILIILVVLTAWNEIPTAVIVLLASELNISDSDAWCFDKWWKSNMWAWICVTWPNWNSQNIAYPKYIHTVKFYHDRYPSRR